MVPVKPDVDNLSKFLLDALTGVLFEDDAQVVDLHMFKIRDSVGLCNGLVALDVRPFNKTTAKIEPPVLSNSIVLIPVAHIVLIMGRALVATGSPCHTISFWCYPCSGAPIRNFK